MLLSNAKCSWCRSVVYSHLGLFSSSIGGIAGPGLVEKLGKKLPIALRDVFKLESEPKILEYAIDSIFWLVEAAKEESQIDLYSLKNYLTSSQMVDSILLQIKQNPNVELKLKVIKITEFFSDYRDFFLLIEQRRVFDEFLAMLEPTEKCQVEGSLEHDMELATYNYFLKGVRFGIFKDPKVPYKLTRIALSRIQ